MKVVVVAWNVGQPYEANPNPIRLVCGLGSSFQKTVMDLLYAFQEELE